LREQPFPIVVVLDLQQENQFTRLRFLSKA
jgi:hypothetical protein